jgi:hypothetical protein
MGENTKKTGVQSCDLHPTRRNDMSKHKYYVDAYGHIRVQNLSAYWIPEQTVTEEIGGTVYTVTGSYEGTESFVKKLERITSKKFAEKMGDLK